MSIQSYVVYEDGQGELGAILDDRGPETKFDLWMEKKKIRGYVAARNEQDACDYIASLLPNRSRS